MIGLSSRAPSARRWLAALLCLTGVLTVLGEARAAPAFAVGPDALAGADLSAHVSYLVDAEGQLTPEQARAASGWETATGPGSLSFGYRRGAIWLGTRIRNASDRERDLRLRIGLPQLDRVEVRVHTSDGQEQLMLAGDAVDARERTLDLLTPTVPLVLAAGATADALIRIESTSSLSLETTLSDREPYWRELASSQLSLGGLIGLLIGLLIYHVAIGIYSGDRGFSWYAAQTIGMLAYVVTVTGVGGRVWGDVPYWAVRAPGFVIALCGASIAQYMRFHLETVGSTALAERALRGGARLGVGVAVATLLLPPRLGAQLGTGATGIVVTIVVATALWRWDSRAAAARLVLGVWGAILLLVSVASVAALGGGLPVGSTRDLLLYAIVVERLAMALPLGARVRSYMLAESRANQAALEAEARALKESEQRARAELALHDRERQLQQSQKLEAVGLLAGGVAHDFNNVLQVVLGCASLLEDDLEDRPQARELLDDMVQAARQAAGLTRQLLVFSRKHVMRPESFDLNALVAEMRKMVERAVGSSVAVEIDCASEPLYVYADRGQLEQALLNLALNAGDAMENGGTIRIRTRRASEPRGQSGTRAQGGAEAFALLEIEDTGVGMSETLQSFVFEPFFTTKEPGRGTGLGLAMVKAAVERNDGMLTLESEVGRGSTFGLYFPLDSAEQRSAPAAPANTLQAPGGSARVLLVEDHPQVLALSRRALGSAGYDVLVAGDGNEALALLEEHASTLDLVVSDVVIPGVPGWQLLQEARKLRSQIPFLFCSGYSPDFVEKRITLDDVTRLLPKPFDQDELLAEVRRMLAPGEHTRVS